MRILTALLCASLFSTAQEPDAVANRMARGDERYKARKYDEAIHEYSKAIELDPKHVKAYVQRGHCHYQKRAYNDAIVDYKAALKLKPNDGGALFALGLAYQLIKDHKGALGVFDKAVELYSTWAKAYERRGQSKRELLDFAGAVEDYGIAVHYAPKLRTAYLARAAVNEDLGNYEAAVADYTTLIEQDATRHVPFRLRARAYFFLDKRTKSDQDFTNALFLKEDDPGTLTTWARMKKLAGDYPGALADCKKAVAINSKDSNPYFIRGLIHYDFKNYRKALLDLKKAIKRANYEPDYIWLYHALTRMRLKEKERGQTELKEYVAQKKEKPTPWFLTVVKFLTGELSEADFLAAAKDETPKTTSERRCEAYFYAGTLRAAAKDAKGALELFRKSVATRVRSFSEYESSSIEIQRDG